MRWLRSGEDLAANMYSVNFVKIFQWANGPLHLKVMGLFANFPLFSIDFTTDFSNSIYIHVLTMAPHEGEQWAFSGENVLMAPGPLPKIITAFHMSCSLFIVIYLI